MSDHTLSFETVCQYFCSHFNGHPVHGGPYTHKILSTPVLYEGILYSELHFILRTHHSFILFLRFIMLYLARLF